MDNNSPKSCPKCESNNITENILKFGIIPERWLCIDCGYTWSRPEDLQEILSAVEENIIKNE